MKLVSVLLVSILLQGCSILRINTKFPEVPDDLLLPCSPLKTIAPEQRTSKIFVNTVVQNYGEYKICSAREEEWINWYKFQVQNYKGIRLWR